MSPAEGKEAHAEGEGLEGATDLTEKTKSGLCGFSNSSVFCRRGRVGAVWSRTGC